MTPLENFKSKFKSFGIELQNLSIKDGTLTKEYLLEFGSGTKFSKVETVIDDISRELKLGDIIITNDTQLGFVKLQSRKNNIPSISKDRSSINPNHRIPIFIGLSSDDEILEYDLTEMLHMLICGATKSGKSVFLKSVIEDLLKLKNIKLVLIDPKLVEFTYFEKSNALASKIITTPSDAIKIFQSLIIEMNSRLEILSKNKSLTIEEYQDSGHTDMPYLVVICDELADLMLASSKQIEGSITRLASKARACGIYLILATQRASVEVVTGDIKVNFGTRICFRVPSDTDSRVILDQTGANKLKGAGDGLFYSHLESSMKRFQGFFTKSEDINIITNNQKFILEDKKPSQLINGSTLNKHIVNLIKRTI